MDNSKLPTATISDLRLDFTSVLEALDTHGAVMIARYRKKKYKLIDIERYPEIEMSDDEKIDFVSKRIMRRYHKAFEELAKW